MRFLLCLLLLAAFGCSEKKAVGTKVLFNIDSLVSLQVEHLRGRYELNKLVQIDGKEEHSRFVPDSAQWANELDMFRLIGQVNKAAFRDAYVVNDIRDTNSNLTVRELKAHGDDTPVSVVRFFYLRNPADIRRIEATLREENPLYTNIRNLTLELEPANGLHLVQRYRIEGHQKMVTADSVRFVIAGEIGL